MATAAGIREPELAGQTVVVIGVMSNTALTGSTYGIDGGQQLLPAE